MLKIINTVAGGGGLFILKIELRMSISMLISQFYYEKSELGEKVRNRIYRYNKNKDSLPIYLRSESLFFVC